MNFQKDPGSTLDYTRDWSAWLKSGETIAASEWSVTGPDSALTVGADEYAPANDDTTATVWLIGGTSGENYVVTNRVTTSNSPPRIDERSFSVQVTQL